MKLKDFKESENVIDLRDDEVLKALDAMSETDKANQRASAQEEGRKAEDEYDSQRTENAGHRDARRKERLKRRAEAEKSVNPDNYASGGMVRGYGKARGGKPCKVR